MSSPMRPLSLALRLTILFSVVTAIVFTVFGWIISRSIEHHFSEGDAAELRLIAQAVEAASPVQPVAGGARTSLRQRLEDILVGHHHASLYVVGANGETIFASKQPNLTELAVMNDDAPTNDALRTWQYDGHSYRALVRKVYAANTAHSALQTIVVAVPIDYHLHFLAAFRDTLWSMIGICIAITGFLGWFLVRQGHAPLRDIVALIRRISADRLNTRVPSETMPTELRDLAVSFNEMLERVDTSFHRLTDFNADIAHELRTPITNLMTQTHVTLSRTRTVDEYREVLYSNMEEYERMAQMVGDMLFLAKTDNCLKIENIEELDLAGEVHALFDYYEGWADEEKVALVLEGAASVSADRLMLRRALANLLSNAIRHTPANGTVRVELAFREGQVTITVENPGPPISPEHLPRIFDRFYRIDKSRERGKHGAGLGLAIVKSIVSAHRGSISASSTKACTRFRIALPNQAKKTAP